MRKASRIIIWTIVALLFVGTFVYLFINSREKSVNYELVSPSTGNISRATVLTGKIEPRDEIEIKPQISGIIAEINVEAGDMVRAGDVIARIKVIPEESQLSAAQSRVSTAKILLDQARQVFDRTRGLYERKFVAREEYEQSETEYKKAVQELDAAEDALRIVREGVSSYNATESNTLVRATIDGQVLEVPVKVGTSVIQANTMNDGTTVAKIADMRNLIFRGKVDETVVGLIKLGLSTEISFGALPVVTPAAVIEYIAPKSTEENGSNTFEIKAAIEVPDSVNLRAGYSANATITLARADSVMTLPESVVEWGGDSAYVYVLTDTVPEHKFERKAISTGLSDGINIQVKGGINADDRLRGSEISGK